MFKVQDINVYIVNFLSNKDHVNLMLVNKKFNEAFNDNIIYKNKIKYITNLYELKIYDDNNICYKKNYLDILKSKELLIKLFGDDTYKKIEEKDFDEIKQFVNNIKDDKESYFYFTKMYFYYADKYLILDEKNEIENLKIIRQTLIPIIELKGYFNNRTDMKIILDFSDYLINLI